MPTVVESTSASSTLEYWNSMEPSAKRIAWASNRTEPAKAVTLHWTIKRPSPMSWVKTPSELAAAGLRSSHKTAIRSFGVAAAGIGSLERSLPKVPKVR